jgi:hypothetical protein
LKEVIVKHPIQTDSVNCGIYLIKFAEFISKAILDRNLSALVINFSNDNASLITYRKQLLKQFYLKSSKSYLLITKLI